MADKRLVIGLGSGRCGTLSLAALLNGLDDAVVTHESMHRCGDVSLPGAERLGADIGGHLPWEPDLDALESRLSAFADAGAAIVGDVAFYYLTYVRAIIERSPCRSVSFA